MVELTPEVLDQYLAVLRKHNVRAARIGEFAVELSPAIDDGPILSVPDEVAGGWKRQASITDTNRDS